MNRSNPHFLNRGPTSGISMLEVLVGLAILTAGLLAVAATFPTVLSAGRDAELLSVAAALANMKAEEIRRDDDVNGRLRIEIRALTIPTDPIEFVHEPRLSYSFSGVSLLYSNVDDPTDPRATPGVARVIIRHARAYDPDQDVIYELRFN